MNQAGFESVGGFAAHGFGEYSPGNFNMTTASITEIIITFIFLVAILGSICSKAPTYLAGLAIGLCLTLIRLISIPVTNTSVNPAGGISQALFAEGGWAMGQLWPFWVVPLVGTIIAGLVYKNLSPKTDD